MKRLTHWLLAAALVAPAWAAHALERGQPLPTVSIPEPGALVPDGDDFDTRPFSTDELLGTVTSIHAVAGRLGIDKINAHYVDALKDAGLPADRFHTVSIIDQDQALFGTGRLVIGKAKDKQREFPTTQFVVDGSGAATEAWGLDRKGYAVIVIDTAGRVLRFHDGKLSDAQVADFVAAIREATAD